jgi:hypothetical protein
MPIHWTHTCPPEAQIWTEVEDGPDGTPVLVVTCNAPGDPPPPDPPPNLSGTASETIGDHDFLIDWELVDGQLLIHDLDMVLSKDEVIG